MRISFIGTGKVAWQLSQGLSSVGHEVMEICGRDIASAEKLAQKMDAKACDNIHDLSLSSEIIIISVSDDVIEELASQINRNYKGIIVHTSGAKELNILPKWNEKNGIFYPLYSFTSKRKIKLDKIPFLITSHSPLVSQTLIGLASSVSDKVYQVTDEDRAQLHLAAVFANNFGNFMMTLGFDRLKKNNIDESILIPIIKQSTANWAKGINREIQTGPAVRGDLRTIDKHIELIKDQKLKKLYKMISDQIKTFYK